MVGDAVCRCFGEGVSPLAKRGQARGCDAAFDCASLEGTRFFDADEVRRAGERGFGLLFDGKANPMYFVVQKHGITFVKAGRYVLNLLQAAKPYLDDVTYVAKQLPQQEQRDAWLKHTAFVAIDLSNKEVGELESYAVLARMGLGLGDERCIGMYVPRLEIMAPNNGAMEEGLREMMRDVTIQTR